VTLKPFWTRISAHRRPARPAPITPMCGFEVWSPPQRCRLLNQHWLRGVQEAENETVTVE
jgi:hypothetical protein